uniref:Virulence-associated protein VapR n=2 Tax=Rhodococcus hoagii TaxID=43767 RepID=A0A0F7ICF4_RHOHA|nr:virulence-associated protein VapR [Prescottella equi]
MTIEGRCSKGNKMKAVRKTVSKSIAATVAVATVAAIPAGVVNAAVLDSGVDIMLSKNPALRAPELKNSDSEQQYPVHGFAASFIFYQTVSILIDDDGRGRAGRTFEGEAGGITTPGAAGFVGVLFTSDLERLYRETVSFEYNAVGPYLNINLFAGDGSLLGHVQSGAISILVGIGGGNGTWL